MPALKRVREIGDLLTSGKPEEAIQKASELCENGYSLSTGACSALAVMVRAIVPDMVNPLMEWDLSGLERLLRRLWDHAVKYQEEDLLDLIGTSMYRWYEHHRRYEESRHVLEVLIRICREQKNRVGEAVLINNFAFEFLLEGRFKEAMPLFAKAEAMFREEGQRFEQANARVNWLECRFGCNALDGMEQIEEELDALLAILETGGTRKMHKPFILLARIEERRGNLDRAIELVELAIQAGKNSRTRFPETDALYLAQLKSQMTAA
jgi:tetratricopeptide (TPR) repeat protein